MTHRLPRRTLALLGLSLLFGTLLLNRTNVPRVSAHPADMYYQTHTITITPDGAEVVWSISPGTLLAYVTWNNADTNDDGEVDEAEANTWGAERVGHYLALVNGNTLSWANITVAWPTSLVDFEQGIQTIDITLTLMWPDDMSADAQIAFYNRYEEFNSSNWFTVQSVDGALFRTPLQQNGAITFQLVLDHNTPVTAEADPPRDYWDSGMPAIGASGAKVSAPPKRREDDTSASARLIDLVRENNRTPLFYLTALGVAIGIGALHALTPGHGKALVGAYLVGSRGTLKHALALGGIVTLTHTGSVLALGFITLAASHILLPTTLFPILEMASGLLVMIMGLALIYRRYKAWQSVRHARTRQSLRDQLPEIPAEMRPAPPSHYTIFPPDAVPAAAAPVEKISSARIQINQPIAVNVYDNVLPQGDLSLGAVNWRALVGLGISGGLVPCPDAIAILLVAVAINRIVLGLSLIVAFSLGLAFILTAIGIMMVRSRRLFEGLNAFNRLIPAMPLISAVIVTGLGLGLTYNAAANSALFKTAQQNDSLDFSFGSPDAGDDDEPAPAAAAFLLDNAQIIYLDTNAANLYQVFSVPAQGGDPHALTDAPFGVWSYALAPDETSIVYAAAGEHGVSHIWQIDIDGANQRLLLTCEKATCSQVIWSPDATRIVYEKLEAGSPLSPLGITALWWYDLTNDTTGPVFRDSQLPSFRAAWSPDGQWLSYLTANNTDVQIYNLNDGSRLTLPGQTGNAVVWSPDASALLMTTLVQREGGPGFFSHLFRYDLATGSTADLTNQPGIGDTWSAWSPDGTWIALVRRVYDGPGASLGDQIWIMRPDGSGACQLTDTPDVVHGTPVWSPDSRYLIYQRYTLAGADGLPGIFLLDTVTGNIEHIVASGTNPTWIS